MSWFGLLLGWLGLLVIGGAILESPYARRRRKLRRAADARAAWRRLIVGGPRRE